MAIRALQKACPSAASAYPYRIMVVDDSATVRGLVRNWVAEEPDLEIVATCGHGLQALKSMASTKPEIIILDIDMPVMDGMTALPQMLQAQPGLKIIVASTLSTRNAAITFEALDLGASDYITKPVSTHGLVGASEYKRDLFEKIRTFGEILRQARNEFLPVVNDDAKVVNAPKSEDNLRTPHQKPLSEYTFQPVSSVVPDIIAIGSSTGGPQALQTLLSGLTGSSLPPLVITQHMPKTFTALLAEHLRKTTGLSCREATHGEALEAGQVYITPGDYHLRVVRDRERVVVNLDQTAPINFCRPSIDPLFESIAQLYGASALSIMLTGMGRDGLAGAQTIVDGGGTVIAQDERSSVVWGMPGAVAEAGLCSRILPLDHMAEMIDALLKGEV